TESLLRKTVRPGYYHSIGKSAYASVAEMKGRGHLDSLFRDLSSRFETYVSLLAEVSEFAAFRKKRSLSERYSKWFHTRNPTVHKEMIEMGLFPSLGSLEIQ
ncbi:MAG: hypothetical protein JKX97_01005, partial [Candidatus Lindowbacteria bacterium]|nr:hypothetical protein [Candidatus Lindowbacteria bacterium]